MLELKNVSKTFNPGTVNEKKAIDKLSLNLNEGDFVTIIGANGAGKSTLFNAICGTFYTDEGQIILDGEDITLQPDYIRAKKIGHLFQDPMSGTAPGMTIEENMALAGSKGGWLSHVSKKEKELFREKLRPLNMGLEDRMHQPVGLLSGGQRQCFPTPSLKRSSRSFTVSFERSSFAASKMMCPLFIMNVRLPSSRADCMLCVIIMHVKWCSAIIDFVRFSTFSAVPGSRAAVCSSRSNSFGGLIVAITRVRA